MVDRGSRIRVFVAATVMATVSLTPQTRSVAITRVNVVDVVNGRILPNSTVTIAGQTIAAVAQNGKPPAGARVVDGQGKFLIPGLWDMHAHVEATGQSSLQLYVANGVTGIRDMGSALDLIVTTREATSSESYYGCCLYAQRPGPFVQSASQRSR